MSEAECAFEGDALAGFDAGGELEVIDVIEGIEEADFVDPTFDKFLERHLDQVFIIVPKSERIGTTEEHLQLELATQIAATIFHRMADGIENGEWVVARGDGYLETLPTGNLRTREARLIGCGDDFRKISRIEHPVLLSKRGLLTITQGEVGEFWEGGIF